MSKLFYCIVTVFVLSGTMFGQGVGDPLLRSPDGSLLLARIFPKDDYAERIIHTIENTADKFEKDPNAVYAIRVCSPDPLPVAFAGASGVALAVRQIMLQLDYLKNTKFLNLPESNIFFLRNNKDCGLKNNSAATEYWFVPSNAELPEFVEIKKHTDLTANGLIFNYSDFDEKLLCISAPEDVALTPRYYEAIKSELVKMLKKNKTSLLLIEAPQFLMKGKIKTIPSQADELKLFLTRKGIGKHRIFIKKSGQYFQNAKPNTDFYPNVTIIYQR